MEAMQQPAPVAAPSAPAAAPAAVPSAAPASGNLFQQAGTLGVSNSLKIAHESSSCGSATRIKQ